jgi:hypothetical protein
MSDMGNTWGKPRKRRGRKLTRRQKFDSVMNAPNYAEAIRRRKKLYGY